MKYTLSLLVYLLLLVDAIVSASELFPDEAEISRAPARACLEDNFEAPGKLSRLTTHAQHVAALEYAFQTAQKKILVTNYGRLYPHVLSTTLFEKLIPNARARNVKIYIRFNHDDKEGSYPPIPEVVQEYFDYHRIVAARIVTHAKLVAVDDQLIMIGSYNWLTDLTSPYFPPNLNHSFVYEGLHTYAMKEHIWKVIKYYRNKEFGKTQKPNYKKAYLFKRDPSNQEFVVYDTEHDSKLTYIALIEKHRSEILRIFQQAKQRIVILSPFVAKNGGDTYQRDFVRKLLSTVLERNIEICFVCLPEHEHRFKEYLAPLLTTYPNLILMTHPNLHAKTLIQDEYLVAEGSFNWLCAARDEVYYSHKHEATLLFEGLLAKGYIKDFYKTELGKRIFRAFASTYSSHSRKRKREGLETLPLETKKIKRERVSSDALTEREFFILRQREVERDWWIHYPFWMKFSSGYNYLVYEKYFEVMSGEWFDKKGYCVRINKEYLKNDSSIIYFPTIDQAKMAAYIVWKTESRVPATIASYS